jgi:hypothetical protein
MIKDTVPCYVCGGTREVDPQTGEPLDCDVCGPRLCEGCEAGNHFQCVGHYCECKECRANAGKHIVCPPCTEDRHDGCLGHGCHCKHFRWHDPDCPECQEAMKDCICGRMHWMLNGTRNAKWEWDCPVHGSTKVDKKEREYHEHEPAALDGCILRGEEIHVGIL